MPSFREMPERDLWAIAQYVSTIGQESKEEIITNYKRSDSSIRKGEKIFAENCAVCHGPKGYGDGVTAATLNPRPKDFSRRLFKKESLLEILNQGVPGAPMPPFPHLSKEVDSLHDFITSVYSEGL